MYIPVCSSFSHEVSLTAAPILYPVGLNSLSPKYLSSLCCSRQIFLENFSTATLWHNDKDWRWYLLQAVLSIIKVKARCVIWQRDNCVIPLRYWLKIPQLKANLFLNTCSLNIYWEISSILFWTNVFIDKDVKKFLMKFVIDTCVHYKYMYFAQMNSECFSTDN